MQYEHDDGMHGISQQSQAGLAAYHDRDDQPHLDDCYGERQHKCSVRLAYPERHYFGVVHGSYHIAEQHCSQQHSMTPEAILPNASKNASRSKGSIAICNGMRSIAGPACGLVAREGAWLNQVLFSTLSLGSRSRRQSVASALRCR
jgi:hypothetical protein